MEKIKIYLQYPWKFPDSPYYKYLIDNPPKNIEYLNIENQKGVIIDKKGVFFSNLLKKLIRGVIQKFKIPLINTHQTKINKGYDLIHCAHCISGNKFPWVADFESSWQIFASGRITFLNQKIINSPLYFQISRR